MTQQQSLNYCFRVVKKANRTLTAARRQLKNAQLYSGMMSTLQRRNYTYDQWRRQDFVTGGEVRYGSIGGLEYAVPQSRLYCLCINVAVCSDGLAMYLSCDTKKFRDNESTHILHNFWTSTHRGKLSPSPWWRHWLGCVLSAAACGCMRLLADRCGSLAA